MEMPVELSLEQEFELRLLKEQVKQLSLNQAQDCFIRCLNKFSFSII
ncbi:MAG: phycobilisome degradation protein NblA [Cyanobacteria bacterium J06633_23]